MSFNPDPNKQAQEVIFSCKIKKSAHLPWIFNNNIVIQSITQKQLGMLLDTKVDFQEYHNSIFSKINTTICLLKQLRSTLQRSPLYAIYKSFIRPNLDYEDIMYDQICSFTFHQKLESIQYNAALSKAGVIRGTSKDKLCNIAFLRF